MAAMALGLAAQPSSSSGVQDPAWSPDGKRLATSTFDRIWISGADGRGGHALRSDSPATERDPAWSPDGKRIAFAADSGEGFDLFVAGADGKDVRRLTDADGDDRWPSYTRDGRIVFSRRATPFDDWRFFVVSEKGSDATPLFPEGSGETEREGRVSPDGKRIAYVSDRESEDGDVDLWVADLDVAERGRVQRTRLTRVRGREGSPSWAPDSSRIAYFAQREGRGSVWVVTIDANTGAAGERPPTPAATPALVSRRGGAPAWSPDGRTIAIAELPPADPAYNGNPLRQDTDPPPLFADEGFALWMVNAPLAVDAGAHPLTTSKPSTRSLTAAFDRVWETLSRLYYSSGPSAAEWARLKDKHRPRAAAAQDEAALESAIDQMIAEQPLIKPAVTSNRAVVVSGHPLASQAGLMALEKGGNVVDAAIAVAFALGVVEPEASGIGGDGMAIVHLAGNGRTGRGRLQGPGSYSRDERQPGAASEHGRRSGGSEYSGRRRGARSSLPPLRQQEGVVGGPDCAGDRVRRQGLRARSVAADVDRRRPRLPPEIRVVTEDLSAGWTCAAAGRAVQQQGLCGDPPRHFRAGRADVLPRRDRPEDCGRHDRAGRIDHAR